MTENILNFVIDWLSGFGLEGKLLIYVKTLLVLIAISVLAFIANWLTKSILYASVHRFVKNSKTEWDDVLLDQKFFARLANYAPAMVVFYSIEHFIFDLPTLILLVKKFTVVYMIILANRVIDSFLNSSLIIYNFSPQAKERPIKGYIQTLKIFIYFITGILVLSVLLNKNPGYFLTGLGALTAVLMLVFKDTILGFVASIQLSANNMIRLGDWIEMPKYGADGEIIEVSLTTVKVQNWDKTITTIPPYALVSDSFKNWRGMQDSDGRRIKRSFLIDVNSISFCDDSTLQVLKAYPGVQEALLENETAKDGSSSVQFYKKVTNLFLFRAYLTFLIKNDPRINTDLSLIVRELSPTPDGLPIEVYAFSKDKNLAAYEELQMDLFNHIYASMSDFNLQSYQHPGSFDVRS